MFSSKERSNLDELQQVMLHNNKSPGMDAKYTSSEHNASDDMAQVRAFMPYRLLFINAWLSPMTLSKTKSKRMNSVHLK